VGRRWHLFWPRHGSLAKVVLLFGPPGKMSKPSADCAPSGEEPRRAPPIGRALRILLGLWLLVYVVPPYFELGVPFAIRALLLVVGLTGVYSLLLIVLSRWTINALLATLIALGLLVALYSAGAPGSLIFGHGEGQLAAGTFLGLSLVIAGEGRPAAGVAEELE
jgi:hypothetical protein